MKTLHSVPSDRLQSYGSLIALAQQYLRGRHFGAIELIVEPGNGEGKFTVYFRECPYEPPLLGPSEDVIALAHRFPKGTMGERVSFGATTYGVLDHHMSFVRASHPGENFNDISLVSLLW